MQTILNWWKSTNASHYMAIAVGLLVAAFWGYPDFHALVLSVYGALPGWLETLIGTAVFLVAMYKPNLAWPLPTGAFGKGAQKEFESSGQSNGRSV